MDTFGYRFLRLNSETLALVEVHSNSDIPEVCQELYPYPPYLTDSRKKLLDSYYNSEGIGEWKKTQEHEFNLAVKEACNLRVIDYSDTKSYCSTIEEREVVLWKILDPLTYWDEFVPLFDNEFNLILR